MPTFSLITFNCFGTPTPRTHRRLRTLAQTLDASTADVVCLQEVQSHFYRRMLLRASHVFRHHAWEQFVHAPKGGLLTLSRAPLRNVRYALYRDRGNWHTPALADWILHKGILAGELWVGEQHVIVLNTHLSANYRGDWTRDNRYVREERAQLQQLAELVAAQDSQALVVVAGDFNVPRGSKLFRAFLAASGLTDPLADDTRPTYRRLPGLPARFALPIDFVLVRTPPGANMQIVSDLCFQEQLPLVGGGQGYLSDHLGVALQLRWGT